MLNRRRMSIPVRKGGRAFVSSLTLFALLSACSTYRGVKYGPATTSSPAVAPDGIPYPLVKPQFLLTISGAAAGTGGKPTASVSYTQVPDTDQNYAIRLEPGPFSTPSFKINFNQGGTIQSTTASTAEQVTPAISAIGSFLIAVAGVVKLGAGAGAADGRKATPLGDGLEALLATPPQACAGRWDYPYQSRSLNDGLKQEAVSTTAAAISARKKLYSQDDEDLAAKTLYVTSDEEACFKALAASNEAALDAAIADYNKKHKSAADLTFSQKIKPSWPNGDLSGASTSMVCQKADGCSDRVEYSAQLALLRDAQTSASLAGFLKHVAEMAPDEWRARYVGFAEAELARIDHAELVAPPPTPVEATAMASYRADLERRRADAVGAHQLYLRSLPLQAYLAQVRMKNVQGGSAPASAEYALYRTELDQIETQIDALRSTSLAVLQPKTSPDPTFTNKPVCWLTDPFVIGGQSVSLADATRNQVKAACHLATAPDYIVGLTRQ